ncbi:hypothetical protein ABC195_12400 [Microbacterium sp. 2P01SA-2]|uniref:hypothetical protein n=1 Tax=unclassified Microbacterium TaxID=2609290 RepID=UPI00399EEBB3
MTDASRDQQPIADPAAQDSDRDDTSIVPDLDADPVEAEQDRIRDAEHGEH